MLFWLACLTWAGTWLSGNWRPRGQTNSWTVTWRFVTRLICSAATLPYLCNYSKDNAGTHTHTRLMALCPGLPGWAGTRKVKPIWILLNQETVSGSGISCTSLQTDNHASTPPLTFLQAGCPSYHPTNTVKALKTKDDADNVWLLYYLSLSCLER